MLTMFMTSRFKHVKLTLRVGVSSVERHSVLVLNGRIECALHVVHPGRNKVQA